jgi:hypothetical protein
MAELKLTRDEQTVNTIWECAQADDWNGAMTALEAYREKIRRETSLYFARRMREAQQAERDGGSAAREAAYVFAETVAKVHAETAAVALAGGEVLDDTKED